MIQLPVSNQAPFGAEAALYFLDDNNQALFCRYDKNGGIRSKFIHPDDIQAAVTGVEFDSGWISHEVLRFGNSPLGRWTVSVHPAHVVRLLLDGETITIPLPKTVMICHHTLVRLFAVAGGKITPTSKLYKYPLPHVGDEGSVCWGNVDRKNDTPPGELLNLFLSSEFSGHSVSDKSRQEPKDVRCMLRNLSAQQATQYPLRDLVPVSNGSKNQTLDGLLQKVIKNG